MKTIDKAVKACDALKDDENSEKEIMVILNDAEKAINMVSTQVKKLNQYEAKLKKYKWGYSQSQNIARAARELQDGIDNALDSVDRAKSITG